MDRVRIRAAALSLVMGIFVGPTAGCDSEDGACSGGDCIFKLEKRLLRVEAVVSPPEIVAGERVTVECRATWSNGDVAAIAPQSNLYTVTPSDGAVLEPDGFTPTVARLLEVRCTPEASEEATVHANAQVIVNAAEPERVEVRLDRAVAKSQQPVRVFCDAVDAFGNSVSDRQFEVRSVPTRGLDVDGFGITPRLVGEYEVTCSMVAPRMASDPALLTVTPGDPAKILVQLDRYSIQAGERSNVLCSVYDAENNPVEARTDFSVSPRPTIADAMGVSPRVKGRYWVTCHQREFDLTATPVLLQVRAGQPASIAITGLTPDKTIYSSVDVLELDASVYDIYGNELEVARWVATSSPAEAGRAAGQHRVRLLSDGTAELIATVSEPTFDGSTVSDRIAVLVDGTAPQIRQPFPARGEQVVGEPGIPIIVSGQIFDDTSGVAQLSINGDPVLPDLDGWFDYEMSPEWGVNTIEIVSSDAAGNIARRVQSFQYARNYRPISIDASAEHLVPAGLMVRLGQPVLDDGDDDVDDLSRIAELAVGRIDLSTVLPPGPIGEYDSSCFWSDNDLEFYVRNMRVGMPDIHFTAIPGGLRATARIPNLQIDIRTSGRAYCVSVNRNGRAWADVATAVMDFRLDSHNGAPRVTSTSAQVSLSGFNFDISFPSAVDWLLDWILGFFRSSVRDMAEDGIRDALRDELPSVIEDLLQSIDIDERIDIPAPIETELAIISSLTTAASDSGLVLGFDTGVAAESALDEEPLGAIALDEHPAAQIANPAALSVGISLDVLNQAMYSLWYGTGLDVELDDALLPEEVVDNGESFYFDATIHGVAAPVLKPTPGAEHPLEVQIGDLGIEIAVDGANDLPPIMVTGYASLFAPASIDFVQGALSLDLADLADVRLELRTNLAGYISEETLRVQLELSFGRLLPSLLEPVLAGITIPSIDLSSAAGDILPDGVILAIDDPMIRVDGAYVILDGGLAADE